MNILIISIIVLSFIGIIINILVYRLEKGGFVAKYIGKQGEKAVATLLERVDGYKYIINDVMINDNGKSRQMDHIAITEHGVFIIETKNYEGTIYGRDTSTEWKKYVRGKCYTFENPIHQNYGHTEVVKRILKDMTDEIFSIVVFSTRCELKVETFNTVIYHNQLIEYIQNRKKVLSPEKIEEINKVINENIITNRETIKNHNYNVRKYTEYKDNIAKEGKCPRCGGELIKRHGKNGDFYGCSNFPKCRYTKDL